MMANLVSKLFAVAAMRYRFRFFSRGALARYQERRIRRIARYAAAHAPFFRQYLQGVDLRHLTLSALDALPRINKRTMMDSFSTYNTAGLDRDRLLKFARDNDRNRVYDQYYQDRYSVGLSSGTSGSSGLAVYAKDEVARSAVKFMGRNGMPPGVRKMHVMFALRTSVPGFSAVNQFGYRLVHYNYDAPLAEVVEGINRFDLNILCGSPAFLLQLAKHASQIRHRVDAVISYAEILEPHAQRLLERAFAAPVRQLYAGTEGYYAAACSYGTLHLNEDILYFNLVPVEGRPSVYNMVVTDLHRTTQPIVNYELNDMIELSSERCRCGSRFRTVRSILGRADDFLLVTGPDGRDVAVYADYVCRALIAASDDVVEYKVVQTSRDELDVQVELLPGSGAASLDRIRTAVDETLRRYAAVAPRVTVSEAQVTFDPDKKTKRVERRFDGDR